MNGLALALGLLGFFIAIAATEHSKAMVKVAEINKSPCKVEAPK